MNRRGEIVTVSCLLALSLCAVACNDATHSTASPYVEVGDMAEIRERGKLRVLIPMLDPNDTLPRRGGPLDADRELIDEFARQQGLDPYWIPVRSRDLLIPYLLEGQGDLIAANLTPTPERRKQLSFTVPVEFVREQVVVRRSDGEVRHPRDLEGRRVAVRRSSSFWKTLKQLQEVYPGIEIEEAPEHLDTDEIIHRVARRRFDVTVADSNLLASTLTYRDDLRVAFDLSEDLPVAWAVRPGSKELLERLDRYLTDAHLTRRRNETRTGDLAEIKEKKVLRLLTRNSAATYFLWRGRLMGFEYDLAHEFARRQGLRLDVVVPRRGEDLLELLVEGKGDLVAAALTPTPAGADRGVAFSRPYNYVSQVVVMPSTETGLREINDLAYRAVFVPKSSASWSTLTHLRNSGVPLILREAPDYLETEEIIDHVADGTYPLTVAESHILDIELTWRSDVDAAFPLGDPVPLAWAVRDTNSELLAAVDAFIREEYRGLTYNVLYRKYFEDPRKIRRHVQHRSRSGALSPYDDLIKRYADEHGFDWRMIVAQAYQESEFDPRARSFAGAVGLLQVLPRTAHELDLVDLEDPETNIQAGLKYLSWVRERFENDLPVRDRMWFTLAAYNVGAGHVRDARRLAAEKGLNPDKWFDNVERAMLLLSRPEYARRAQHGYCRGSEPVKYVREIRSRYEAYLDTLATQQLAEAGSDLTF